MARQNKVRLGNTKQGKTTHGDKTCCVYVNLVLPSVYFPFPETCSSFILWHHTSYITCAPEPTFDPFLGRKVMYTCFLFQEHYFPYLNFVMWNAFSSIERLLNCWANIHRKYERKNKKWLSFNVRVLFVCFCVPIKLKLLVIFVGTYFYRTKAKVCKWNFDHICKGWLLQVKLTHWSTISASKTFTSL